jgi:hypothetical protein
VAGRTVRWTIEAKSPEESLDAKTEAQAWSYANHPEIRGVYFVLSNGRRFQIFQTNRGAAAPPIFESRYEELHANLTVIHNILAPSSVLRDNPPSEVDTGRPIAPGLRSSVRITGGRVLFDSISPPIPQMKGMLMSVTGGVIDRHDDGTVRAHLIAMVLNQAIQAANEKFGLNDMHLNSDSREVSCDPANPTVFRSQRAVCLPAGESILNMKDWTIVTVPLDIHVVVHTEASGHLHEQEFVGRFTGKFRYPDGFLQVTEGDFRISVA